ncbi:MAG TPA: VCBS repeat-containing protein, partial [Thermoanaerobaculia bacterium]
MPAEPRSRRWASALVPAGLLAATGLWLAASFPGLARGATDQLRHGTWGETRNLWDYVSYLLAFLEKLTWNPESGIYDFRLTPEEGLDGLERGRLAFHRGQFARAAALIEDHVGSRGESEEALLWLALSHLRLAESENCLEKLKEPVHAGHLDAAAFCSLPLRRTHERQHGSRRAAKVLERLLDRWGDGSDGRLYRWLLNLSYMTVDGFPGEVPARHLIRSPFMDAFYGAEAERVRRGHADLRFVDRALELGVENFGTGRGVAVEDFDGDGDLDLVATGSFGGVRLYRNEGGERFADATAGSGLEAVRQPLTVSAADYDGDGRMDLFVARPYSHYLLFANQGDGRFRDVTRAAGLLDGLPEGTLTTTWISTWGDVDDDGDLDLFVSSWAFKVPFVAGLPARPRLDSQLFLNEEGRFRDVTQEWGLADRVRDRHLIGAAFGDYDGDGWADLYLTGPLPGTSALLRNLSGRRFAPESAVDWSEPGFTATFVDVDHDGRLDVFHGGTSDARTAIDQAVFGIR